VLATAAGFLAGMVTDTAANAGERESLPDEVEGFFKTALGDEGHVALHVDSSRASGLAGGREALFDSVNSGHSTRDVIDSLLGAAIPLDGDSTDLGAFAAVGAAGGVYVMGCLGDFEFQAVASSSLVGNPSLCEHIDERVLQRLKGSGLPGQGTWSEERRLLDKVDFEACSGQVKGGLEPCRCTSDDKHFSGHFYFPWL